MAAPSKVLGRTRPNDSAFSEKLMSRNGLIFAGFTAVLVILFFIDENALQGLGFYKMGATSDAIRYDTTSIMPPVSDATPVISSEPSSVAVPPAWDYAAPAPTQPEAAPALAQPASTQSVSPNLWGEVRGHSVPEPVKPVWVPASSLSSSSSSPQTSSWHGDRSAQELQGVPDYVFAPYKINPNPSSCKFTAQDVAYTVKRIEEAPLVEKPYPHMFVTEVFPPAVYECMMAKLPNSTKAYVPLSPKAKDRRVIALRNRAMDRPTYKDSKGKWVAKKSEHGFDVGYWAGFAKQFGGDAVRMAYLRKFAGTVTKRAAFRKAPPTPKNSFWRIMLTRDLGGYEIGPHTDTNDKLVTILYYLPHPSDASHMNEGGTAVIKTESNLEQRDHSEWESWQRKVEGGGGAEFSVSFQAPYLPNSAFVFAPCFQAWHGVPLIQGSFRRDTIQSFIMSQTKSIKNHCPGAPPNGKQVPRPPTTGPKKSPSKGKKGR